MNPKNRHYSREEEKRQLRRIKRTFKQMGIILKNMGTQTGKVLDSLKKSDEELNKKLMNLDKWQ